MAKPQVRKDKPMRDVSKSTPKEGSDGPPSSIKSKGGEQKGHKQSGGAKKSAEGDMDQQRRNMDKQPVDPFKELMAAAGANARYSLPQGFVDPGDITRISPDEHLNMPQRGMRRG